MRRVRSRAGCPSPRRWSLTPMTDTHSAAQRIERDADKTRDTLNGLIRDFDGSEILDVEIQEATLKSSDRRRGGPRPGDHPRRGRRQLHDRDGRGLEPLEGLGEGVPHHGGADRSARRDPGEQGPQAHGGLPGRDDYGVPRGAAGRHRRRRWADLRRP
jgi:hypothetical protein